MKVKNEDDLDNLIFCKQCFTLHQEVKIKKGTHACCSECDSVLYRSNSHLIDSNLALSITGIIFFIVVNSFPLVQIEILGHEQFLTIPKMINALFDRGFYLVGILCSFLIFIFPLMIFLINMMLFFLLKIQIGVNITKELLILLAHIKPWSMSDIFLISILVALVKLIGYAQIHLGIAFWALILFIIFDIYISKKVTISEIWIMRKKIFLEKDSKSD